MMAQLAEMKSHIETLLDAKERQLQQAGTLMQRVLAQQTELKERTRELREIESKSSDEDKVDDDLSKRYQETVAIFNSWDLENASRPAERLADGTNRSTSLTLSEISETLAAPTRTFAPQSQHAINAAHRADDVEIAFERGSGLLTEVRRLLSLVSELDTTMLDMEEEIDGLKRTILDKTVETDDLKRTILDKIVDIDDYKNYVDALETTLLNKERCLSELHLPPYMPQGRPHVNAAIPQVIKWFLRWTIHDDVVANVTDDVAMGKILDRLKGLWMLIFTGDVAMFFGVWAILAITPGGVWNVNKHAEISVTITGVLALLSLVTCIRNIHWYWFCSVLKFHEIAGDPWNSYALFSLSVQLPLWLMEVGYVAAADVLVQVFFPEIQICVYTLGMLLLPLLIGLQPTWYFLSVVFYHLPVGLSQDFWHLVISMCGILAQYYHHL